MSEPCQVRGLGLTKSIVFELQFFKGKIITFFVYIFFNYLFTLHILNCYSNFFTKIPEKFNPNKLSLDFECKTVSWDNFKWMHNYFTKDTAINTVKS